MAVLVQAVARATEGGLERKGVNQLKFLPHDDTSSGLLSFLNLEVAGFKAEVLSVLAENQRFNKVIITHRLGLKEVSGCNLSF